MLPMEYWQGNGLAKNRLMQIAGCPFGENCRFLMNK